jgi:hypothetical protein
MRENKQEYPCQLINMSAGGMAMLAPVACDIDERIVAYLDNLGRIEGIVGAASRAASPCASWAASTSASALPIY